MAIDFTNETVTAHIEPRPETARDNIRRTRILIALSETDLDASELFYFSACVPTASGAIIINGETVDIRDLTIEQFVNLPGPLFTAWVNKALELNPHFLDTGERAITSDKDAEKKSK